ncbi:hypothetical protein DFH09DRAFT_1328706 [Mycena vulgaris]|nr:hypothetical protein DFH09DRAFT_1328706 [Mycena vulgaris]
MEFFSGTKVQKLHDFHHACGMRAESLVEANAVPQEAYNLGDPNQFTSDGDGPYDMFPWWYLTSHTASCGPREEVMDGGQYVDRSPAEWFRRHILRVATELRKLPTGRTVEVAVIDVLPAEHAIISGYPRCSQHADGALRSFALLLAAAVDESNQKLAKGMLGI